MLYILFHLILKHYNVLLYSLQGQRKDDFHNDNKTEIFFLK